MTPNRSTRTTAHRATHPTTHRGVALLLTLATLVIVTTALAVLMRLATTEALNRETRSRAEHAESLLRSAEAPILHWLIRESHRTVLPPETETPAVAILNDAWTSGHDQARLRITAFDQRGMPSQSMLTPGSPMRTAVPSELLDRLEEIDLETWRTAPGLDLLIAPSARSPYPSHHSAPPIAYNDHQRQSTSATATPNPGAAGALLATHNPPPNEASSRRRRRSPAAINVSTAPIDIVRHALRMAGRAGIETIIDARSRGEKPAVAGDPIGEPHPGAPVIIAVSDVWSFRVDASVGEVTRTHWLTYARRDAGWKLLQRLEIER